MIVEDHAIFREGLKRVINQMEDIELVGEAENGSVFLALLDKLSPDILIMDIKMPVMDGMEASGKALERVPSLKIIILTMYGEEQYLFAMINKGVSGFLLKTARVSEIEAAIRAVIAGEQYYSPEINGMLAKKLRQYNSQDVTKFTQREREVLDLLCQGVSTPEIASLLNVSVRTVEGYRGKLLEKTGQPNVLNLIIYAITNKLAIPGELHVKN